MRIAVLSGAYINAGDYLIEKRTCELLSYLIPNCSLIIIKRNCIKDNINLINDCNIAVIAGGPVYENKPENILPLKEMLNYITTKMIILGGGWYGINNGRHTPYEYAFSDLGKLFLKKIDNNGGGLGCRDIPSYKTLRKEGYKNVVLTGCPAWYCLDWLNSSRSLRIDIIPRNIAISDPANEINYRQLDKVIDYVRKKFKNANITLVVHRNNRQKIQRTIGNKVRVIDITSNPDGIEFYDNIDLHIGFRVHAHIFCLSKGIPSILIEEDGRGGGVNETLGLPSIKAYDDKIQTYNRIINRLNKAINRYSNQYLVDDINLYYELLSSTDYSYIRSASNMICHYYGQMEQFIRGEIIGS